MRGENEKGKGGEGTEASRSLSSLVSTVLNGAVPQQWEQCMRSLHVDGQAP